MLYNLIIIGTGPAGLAASIYASRYGTKHLIIGALKGGTASEAYIIENYPGYKSISGKELMEKFIGHAKSYQPEILSAEISNIKKKKGIFEIKTNLNKTFKAKTLILSVGTNYRRLLVPGEKEFLGRGVSYCFTCDGPLFKNKVVAVIGGGDSALTAALFLAKQSKKIYLIHRRKDFRGQVIWQKKVDQNKKIVKILANQIKEIKGHNLVEEIVLGEPYQGKKRLKVNGLFIEIGVQPISKGLFLDPPLKLKKNKAGYIITDHLMQTNIPGLFAAGDITGPPDKLRQIVTAAAEGAIAATGAQRFLGKTKSRSK